MSLSEADTRAKLIDPKLYKCGWTEEHIKREETAGTIIIVGAKGKQRKGTTDYTLRIKIDSDSQPVAVAVIEAKAEKHAPDEGLEQAKLYGAAKRLNVRFVYSTNGHQFVEFNRKTQVTSEPRPLEEFPSPEELRARYEQQVGFSLESEVAKPLLQHYYNGEGGRRYYQDAAIRAVFEKLAADKLTEGLPRALLSLATGAGKTFIAVNLLKRIDSAGQLKKALFICDRDELRTQAGVAFQKAFGDNAAEVASGKPQKTAKVLIATYQTLDVDTEISSANFLTQNYPPDYFSHIVIDECHRSAWGKWKQVFDRNPNAVQIGLTATPRKLKLPKGEKDNAEAKADERLIRDNYRHFGEPVYEYDLTQGIEDGYLAACEIIGRDILINEKREREAQKGVDRELNTAKISDARTGKKMSREELRKKYEAAALDSQLRLPDRVKALSEDIFAQLLENGGTPEQKTIIFCASDPHAQDIANAMGNLYSAWCRREGRKMKDNYAFKCTSKSSGNDFLPDFRGSNSSYFVATTVDLLTTGVDVPNVRNIVFFRYLKSPILFYQMLGRGTRLDEGKLLFRVYDYTDATRLLGKEFLSALAGEKTKAEDGGDDDEDGEDDEAKPMPQAVGIEFGVSEVGRYVPVMVDGKHTKVSVEEYKRLLAERLIKEADTLDKFRARWISPKERRALIDSLIKSGLSPAQVQKIGGMVDYDLYDVLAELGYGINPRRKQERVYAFTYKHEDWLRSMPSEAQETIKAMIEPFALGGTEELENPNMLQMPAVSRAGGMKALAATGRTPLEVFAEAKERLFAA